MERVLPPASNDGPELFHRLQRLALAACEAFEDGSLVFNQFLADDGDESTRQAAQLPPASNRPK